MLALAKFYKFVLAVQCTFLVFYPRLPEMGEKNRKNKNE